MQSQKSKTQKMKKRLPAIEAWICLRFGLNPSQLELRTNLNHPDALTFSDMLVYRHPKLDIINIGRKFLTSSKTGIRIGEKEGYGGQRFLAFEKGYNGEQANYEDNPDLNDFYNMGFESRLKIFQTL